MTYPLVSADSVYLLKQQEQIATIISQIEMAKSKIWSSYFIAALSANEVNHTRIKEIMDALGRAVNRGVDVRFIIGDFEDQVDGFNVNLIAARYLHSIGVPVKLFNHPYKDSTHSKEWIFDYDTQMVGSGNLTVGGLLKNNEIGLKVVSGPLNILLTERFESAWEQALTLNW